MGETSPFDGNGAGDAGELLVGRTIAGKFVLEAVVGAGAMGVVYRARQTTLEKIVAIKVMHARVAANKTYAARFQLEARTASRLDHPNSVRVLDFGQEPDGLLYIAMEYLGGRDLLEVLNQEWPLSAQRIVDILSQALSALAVAHDMGILHRDLKPENLMMLRTVSDDGTPTDNVKVCDFGIAKIDEPQDEKTDSPKLTTGHLVVGTPAYMAPEQAQSEPIDRRTDVYSMGVILYQLLTRRVPFEGTTPLATVLKLTQDEAVPPSTLVPNVDAELEEVCLKAMSKKPADRYASARDMRVALRAVVSGGGSSGAHSVRKNRNELNTLPAPRARPRFAWVWGGVAAVVGFSGAYFIDRTHRRPATAVVIDPAPAPAGSIEEHAVPTAEASRASTASAPADSPIGSAPSSKTRKTKGASPEGAERPAHASATPSSSVASAPASAADTPPPVVPPPVAARPAETIPTEPARVVPAPIDPRPAPPPAPPPQIDPNLARVEIASATNATGTTTASVNKVMSSLGGKLTACYRAALPQAVASSANLHIETDLDGVIVAARVSPALAPALTSCIVSAVRGHKIPNVDTGTAVADVPLSFKPR